MRDIITWLAIFLVILLMFFKWRIGLYGILDDAIAWIRRRKNQ